MASERFPASERASVAAAPPGVCERAAPSKKTGPCRPEVLCCQSSGRADCVMLLFGGPSALRPALLPSWQNHRRTGLFVLVSHICQPWVEVAEDVFSPVCRDVTGGIPKEP